MQFYPQIFPGIYRRSTLVTIDNQKIKKSFAYLFTFRISSFVTTPPATMSSFPLTYHTNPLRDTVSSRTARLEKRTAQRSPSSQSRINSTRLYYRVSTKKKKKKQSIVKRFLRSFTPFYDC